MGTSVILAPSRKQINSLPLHLRRIGSLHAFAGIRTSAVDPVRPLSCRPAPDLGPALWVQQTKDGDTGSRANINVTIGNRRCDEMGGGPEIVPCARLVAVVVLIGQVGGVIGT